MSYDNTRLLLVCAAAGELLRKPVTRGSFTPVLLELEPLRVELLTIRCEWTEMLMNKKSQYLHPKDKDLTEMDRKIMLNASLANIERDLAFIEGIEQLIEQRLELGKLL